MSSAAQIHDEDERALAELGYKQELKRGWSSFSNFAISFTIISVLAGCFTTYGQAWNNGGPVAHSRGGPSLCGLCLLGACPVICGLILLVAFSMAGLVSAYPTAGGIYYWASTLGGPKWGWFTGWFNWGGLVGVVAAVDYGCAQFLNATLSLYRLNLGFANWGDTAHIMSETFLLFTLILILHALINIFSSPLVALFNNISVFWHVAGVAVIVLVLALIPDHHQSVRFVFGHTINNSGFGHSMFWWYVLPLGFLLTMYTQTGYDASAHISEETHGAAKAAAQAVWRSVFWSGVGGWIVLLAITFAATDVDGSYKLAGGSLAVFSTSPSESWQKVVVVIATIGQLFCGMACVTSCSRMTYAFSGDRAVPGWRLWTRLNHHRVPAYAVVFSCVAAMVMTLPALEGDANGAPYAFFAVVSICVVGLYIAYVLPVFLRWRKG